MGAYDSNPRRDSGYDSNPRPPWNPSDVDKVNDRLSGLTVSESPDTRSSVYQVLRAVEIAEDTIKQQMEEKLQLQDELLRLERELEKYAMPVKGHKRVNPEEVLINQKSLESTSGRPAADVLRSVHSMGPYKTHISNIPGGNEAEKVRWMGTNPSLNHHGTLFIPQNGAPELDNPVLGTSTENPRYSESIEANGSLKVFTGMQTGVDSAGVSQLSTPSSTPLSPTRHRKEREYDPRFNLSGRGLIPVSETSSNNLWKQDLAIKVRERDEEIAMLRKHLSDYSVKEAQMRNEKYVLEKRIAYMRMAFDQQQQDLVDAASKALSYRQDIMEENIRLTYALQAAQQERTIFVSSLMPLLTEYNLQPPTLDAQSIVGNLKVLFKHLQEKLMITEDKLKESQYQLAPSRIEASKNTSFPPQSPSHSFRAPVPNSNNSLEIVPQTTYSYAQSPISSSSNAQPKPDWEAVGNQNHNPGPSTFAAKQLDQEGLERIPLNRNTRAHDNSAKTVTYDTSAQVIEGDSHVARFNVEFKDQNPSFKDLVRAKEIDDPEPSVLKHGREDAVHWGPATSPYLSSGLDDANSSYPYLPAVLEEPSSSFSEAAEDDPLPAIEGLQITGEAFPGRELQASGYSINGTTSCNFEWVRYLEDGSVNYIEGAKQPKYLLTADDVHSYLAIEVHPLDDKNRKGELVKVFANEQRKITCDPEMQEQIEKTFSIGHMSCEVLLSVKYLDIWEQAVLAIKREGYSIKCDGPRGVVVAEKFLPTTAISIPYGHPAEFLIHCANGDEYLLRAKDSSWPRDTIVLTMRLFKKMAEEKRKGRKKRLFFKS